MGAGNDDTLPDHGLATAPTGLVRAAPDARGLAYDLGEVIGRGGMGEVVLARDRRIGRDVAIKRMLTAEPSEESLQRFLREAKIQARLDHPAIVPVHELGFDADGRPYFTMKRLTGTTLFELLQRRDESPQRLLRAFVDVCRAIDFAHTRRIVHRDLKPSNIMLGDYGEVYVLDWGVARVLGDAGEQADTLDIPSVDGATQAGALLGTPGYMAPEQVRGEAVTPAADLYALGAILFEILAGEPLHPRTQAALSTTLDAPTESPARRTPGRAIPPELDAACTDALAADPEARPTARELADRLQRYLDGDRDHERRRALAGDELTVARAALDRGDRAQAMHSAGRALALDPESREAAAIVTKLMLEPPAEPPAALAAELRDSDATDVSTHARRAAAVYLLPLITIPAFLFYGVKHWWIVAAWLGTGVVLAVAALAIARRPDRGVWWMTVYSLGPATFIALVGHIAPALMFGPALACAITASMSAYPDLARRRFVPWLMAAAWIVPLVVVRTWSVTGDAVTAGSYAMRVRGDATVGFVMFGTVGAIVITGFLSGSHTRALMAVKHRLVSQAWHLRQLLPRD